MKKIIPKLIAFFIIILTFVPLSVIYFPLSKAIPNLPVVDMPNWLIPAGFISIVCIIMLAFALAHYQKD